MAYLRYFLLPSLICTALAWAAPLAFFQEVLASTPIGYWRFDEISISESALDSSGNGHDGSYSEEGIELRARGVNGGDNGARFLDQQQGSVTVAESSLLNPTEITMEVLVRFPTPLSDGTAQQSLICKPGLDEPVYFLGFEPFEQIIVAKIQTSGGTFQVKSSPLLQPDQELHIVATFDGNNLILFINGEKESTTAASGTLVSSDKDLFLGNAPDNDAFVGVLDEVAIYDRPLLKNEILSHYQAAFGLEKGKPQEKE